MSIYEFLKDKSADEIAAGGYPLPDSGDLCLRHGEVWVPGAYEGTLLRTDARIKQHLIMDYHIAAAVKRQALHPSEAHFKKMHKLLMKYSAISIADAICSISVALKLVHTTERKTALRRLAMDLITNSSKREPVKIGIALLGICGKPDDMELLLPLGMHDEFTLYVVGTAVRLLSSEALNDYLIDLAGKVQGWGKIAILYELDYSDPEIRLWTIKHGCRNSVGLSYLSNVCATKGKMLEVLFILNGEAQADEDLTGEDEKELFAGICDIFTGFLSPSGSNDGLADYADARAASKAFAQLCGKRPDLAETDDRTENILEGLKFIL